MTTNNAFDTLSTLATSGGSIQYYDLKKLGGKRATRDTCSRRIAEMDYQQQAAHYGFIFDTDEFVWVFCEDEAPFGIAKFMADSECMRIGNARNDWAYWQITKSKASGIWPSYSGTGSIISLPRWKVKQEEEELE